MSLANFGRTAIALLLFFHAVIVHFDEEIFRAKNVAIFGGSFVSLSRCCSA